MTAQSNNIHLFWKVDASHHSAFGCCAVWRVLGIHMFFCLPCELCTREPLLYLLPEL